MTRRLPDLLVAAMFGLALLAQTVRAWHRLEASVLAQTVQRQMVVLRGSRVPAAMVRASEAALERAHDDDPAAIEPLAFLADLQQISGRFTDAEASYQRAAFHEPRPEVLINWGLALWRLGRTEEAVVQLRRAVALAPRLGAELPAGARPLVEAAPLIAIPPLLPPVAGGADGGAVHR